MPKFVVSGAQFMIDAENADRAVEQLEDRLGGALPDVPVMGVITARPAPVVPRIPQTMPGTVNVSADAGSVAMGGEGLAAGQDVNITATGGSVAIGGAIHGGVVIGDGNIQINRF